MQLPGILSGRVDRLQSMMADITWQCMATFEFDTDDVAAIIPEIERHIRAGEMELTDALAMSKVALFTV